MSDPLDPRIGTFNDDGSVLAWPELDISGQSYTRPINMAGLGARHFVVFSGDRFSDEQRAALIAALPRQPKGKSSE